MSAVSTVTSTALEGVTKCIMRSATTSTAVSAAFPPRIGRPAYTATSVYSNIDTLATTSLSTPCTTTSTPTSTSTAAAAADALANTLQTPAIENVSRRFEDIVCKTKNCKGSGDWLTKLPVAAAAWAVGAVVLVLALWFIIPTFSWESPAFYRGTLAMLSLCVSLFLRAAISKLPETGNALAVYKSSLFFNYFAGALLCNLLVVVVIKLGSHFNTLTGKKHIASIVLPYVLLACLTALLAVAVALMFNENSIDALTISSEEMTGVSTRLIQAAMLLIIVVSLGASAHVSKIAKREGSQYFTRQLTICFTTVGFLLLWASFMFARTFVSLSNPARSSEVMFYLLNALPLVMVVSVMIILNAPLALNFQMTANWKWVV